jgi:hypothetical protein
MSKTENQNYRKGFWDFAFLFWKTLLPLIYLFFWYFIPTYLLGVPILDGKTLIICSLPLVFIGVISQQTSWSIGGEYGIHGDNIGKKMEATLDGRGSFKLHGNVEDKWANCITEAVKGNANPNPNSTE